MGRRKAGETPAQRSARLEERDRRRQRRSRETEAEREARLQRAREARQVASCYRAFAPKSEAVNCWDNRATLNAYGGA